MAELTDAQKLQIIGIREKIGEMVPEGGTDTDTLFTDEQILVWIETLPSVNSVIAGAWESKMAHWSGLVNVTDGAASRAFSDLFEHARLMASYWNKKLTPQTGRSRVGKIERN